MPGAGHVDLYDRVNLIPFDKLTAFFQNNLKNVRLTNCSHAKGTRQPDVRWIEEKRC